MGAPTAPSAPVATPTQEVLAPHVEEVSTTAVPEPSEPLAAPGTAGEEDSEQPTALPDKWQEHPDVAAFTAERVKAKDTEAAKALEFRLAQQHNDLTAQRLRKSVV